MYSWLIESTLIQQKIYLNCSARQFLGGGSLVISVSPLANADSGQNLNQYMFNSVCLPAWFSSLWPNVK